MKCWLTAASYLFSSILKDESVAESVCAHSHEVDGRAVEVKKAVPRGELRRDSSSSGEGTGAQRSATARIFVARIKSTVTDADFRAYFEQFGPISDAYMPKDHVTREHRGIGFITYDSPGPVEEVMEQTHELDGQQVAVDRATPKDESHGRSRRGGALGRGGGRGAAGAGGRAGAGQAALLQNLARMGIYPGAGAPGMAPYGVQAAHYGYGAPGVMSPTQAAYVAAGFTGQYGSAAGVMPQAHIAPGAPPGMMPGAGWMGVPSAAAAQAGAAAAGASAYSAGLSPSAQYAMGGAGQYGAPSVQQQLQAQQAQVQAQILAAQTAAAIGAQGSDGGLDQGAHGLESYQKEQLSLAVTALEGGERGARPRPPGDDPSSRWTDTRGHPRGPDSPY